MDIKMLKSYPLKAFMWLERYVNQRNYSRFCNDSDVSEKYTPMSDNESFDIKILDDIPKVILNSKSKTAKIISRECLFFIHPDSEYKFETKEREFKAIPTASTRTILLVNFSVPIFVKTSVPKRISRFKRDLNENSVRHSLAISKEIKDLCYKTKDFGCLYEIAGSIYKGVGNIFRECRASPKRNNRILIPLFSLYSFDSKNPSDKLLIEEISRKSKISILELLKWILKKIIEFWCLTVKEKGLILEMHAQNTLLEVDYRFVPRRIIVRDFCSVRVDKQIRERIGIDTNFSRKVIGKNSNFNREEEYSLVYDYLISHHFLIPMLEICCKKYRLDFEYLLRYCIKIFKKNFQMEDIFTNKCYGYTDEIFIDKKPRLTVFSEKPLLR